MQLIIQFSDEERVTFRMESMMYFLPESVSNRTEMYYFQLLFLSWLYMLRSILLHFTFFFVRIEFFISKAFYIDSLQSSCASTFHVPCLICYVFIFFRFFPLFQFSLFSLFALVTNDNNDKTHEIIQKKNNNNNKTTPTA